MAPDPLMVKLTWSEMLLAHYVAGHRLVQNLKKGAQAAHGADPSRESDVEHLTACRGEMAVAKALNLFWSGSVGDYSAVDVGGVVEVRACNRKPGARLSLILHKNGRDQGKDGLPFVCADTSAAPVISLHGWIVGRDGKKDQWWRDPTGNNRHAYFVPLDELRWMHDLAGWLKSQEAA